MKQNRHAVGQIIAKLRHADVEIGHSSTTMSLLVKVSLATRSPFGLERRAGTSHE